MKIAVGCAFFALAILLSFRFISFKKESAMTFAPAPKKPHRMEIHGDVRNDDYFWMRERDSQAVLDYLSQENQRTENALARVRKLEDKIYNEMRSRIKENDSSVPVFDHGYWYYVRYETGQEHPLHCRKKGQLEAPEEVILDENILAKGHTYFDLGEASTSPDQRYYAFAVDTVGRRIYDIYVKDLSTGQLLADKVVNVTSDFAWAADNKTLFYVRQDPETLRPFEVYRATLLESDALGTLKSELVYAEKDTTYNVGLSSSKTGDRLYMAIEKRDSSEWRVLDAHHPQGSWHTFASRENDMEYSLVDGGEKIYVLTNWKARNFRVMEAMPEAHDKTQWKEVIPASEKIYIEGLDAYKDFLVISQREKGLTQIRLRDRASGESRVLKYEDPAYEVAPTSLPMYDSATLRFNYQSLVRPPSVYDEDMRTGERHLRKVREVPGYNPDLYESKRLWAKAKDGQMVPISLVMKKGRKLSGGPALLYGYGSYGLTNDIYFRSSVLSLLDRGFVFALAHVRGGSEMGREWYEQGRLQHKMNTFTDFIASAETLVAEKYTSPKHFYIMGGSAGGLLMGAVTNLRPDLFNGTIAAVPFVDVLTTMLDESIPLTTGEYKEWGDPRIKAEYMYMRQYSPYDNVERKNYPNIFVTTGYHDSQVQYWEPAKWVAKLRELKTDSNFLLFYTEMDAGHSGASGRFAALKTLAKQYAFILMLEGQKDE